MKFEDKAWSEVKNSSFQTITLNKERIKVLEKVGYNVDTRGYIIDAKTKKKVKAITDNKSINVKIDNKFALIAGSHLFVRNVVDYSRYLAEKGKLPKIEPKKD